MRTKFIEQGSAKDGKTVVDIPKHPYLGFILRVRGTTDAGKTLALADIGDLRLERSGSQKQKQSFEFFHERADLKRGYPKGVSGNAASAEDVVAWMPLYYDGLPNVMDIQDKDEVDLTLDFDATKLADKFGSNACTYELYGIVEEAVSEKYVMDVRTQNIQATSSGRLGETLSRSNIAGIILEDSADKVDEVTFTVDGQVIWDNIDQDVITIITNLSNQVESAGNKLGEINIVETGDIRESYNKTSKLDVNFNAAGTLNVTIFSIEESPVVDMSRARRAEFLSKRERSFTANG